MITLDEALAAYPREVQPLATEPLDLHDALHRVLRDRARARCDLPRFSQSALDGYVLTQDDAARAPITLRISGCIAAGDRQVLPSLVNGECQRILTGARVPPNAGAVVAQERVNVSADQITLHEALKPGANIRWQGEELHEGTTLGTSGQRLTPGHIAALAAAGVATVTVSQQPRIVVLVSGDEVKPVGTALATGQIWDANGPLILAWLRSRGYPAQLRYLGDQRQAVEQSLQQAFDHADLVITTGGVSVGDKDYIVPVAEQLGARRVFWQVAQKPGKPLLFCKRGPTVLMGLPGNPGAVLIGLSLHVRAVLDRLEGAERVGADWHGAKLASAVKADARRDCLLRMRLEIGADGSACLYPLPHQDSHMLSNLGTADVLVRAPARDQIYAAGEMLNWTPL